jgi:hypothetical protein
MAWAFQTDISGGRGLKSTPLLVDGVLYFTEPDDVWAMDARGAASIHVRLSGMNVLRFARNAEWLLSVAGWLELPTPG